MSNSGQNTGSKKQTYIIIILALLVVIAVGVIIFLVMGKDDTMIKEDPSGGRGTVITQDNVDEFLNNDNSETVQDGHYTTSMSLNWHFDGKVSKDAYVANVTKNTRTVYFDLFLADSNEMIYSSPYIPVGAKLQGITLDKELATGTYETILVYHLVDDDNQELSTVSIALTIYVN